jgi:hypothetical protein
MKNLNESFLTDVFQGVYAFGIGQLVLKGLIGWDKNSEGIRTGQSSSNPEATSASPIYQNDHCRHYSLQERVG